MTPDMMQTALAEDLQQLFEGYGYKNSMGMEMPIRVFCQDLPIREGDDEETDPEAPPEPYVIVRIAKGEFPGPGVEQTAELALVLCVVDPSKDRQGYRDAMHLVNAILHRYGGRPIFGGKYEIVAPIRWAFQDEDTHPYYFAAVGLKVLTPAIYQELEFV